MYYTILRSMDEGTWLCHLTERRGSADYSDLKFRTSVHWEHTVDGRNPAPVEMQFIPLFTGFYASQVVSRISSINSTSEDTTWIWYAIMPTWPTSHPPNQSTRVKDKSDNFSILCRKKTSTLFNLAYLVNKKESYKTEIKENRWSRDTQDSGNPFFNHLIE